MNSRERVLLRDQSGMTLAFVALLLFVFLGVAALAVDLGMLMTARTEAQRVADAAALAGAGVLTGSPDDEELAKGTAQHFASLNDIRNVPAEIDPNEPNEDVKVDLDEWKVTVSVLRTEERGNPMTNLFARTIGIDTTDVSAEAAARWSPAGGANCMLPFALPDRWWEEVAPGIGDSQSGPWPKKDPLTGEWDKFDPAEGDVYEPLFVFNEDGDIIEGPNEPHSSYNEYARGTPMRITTNEGGGTGWFPATYFAIRFPGDPNNGGAERYEERIKGCPEPDVVWYPGQLVPQEPGNMVGKTKSGFTDLIRQAPNHEWRSSGSGVPEDGCVWDPDRAGGAGCIPAFDSPRTRVLPLFSPPEFPDNSSHPFRISSFIGLFVEELDGNDVIARFVEYRGAEALPPGNDDVPVLARILQLVE